MKLEQSARTYLLSSIERPLIERYLGGIPETSEHDPLQFP